MKSGLGQPQALSHGMRRGLRGETAEPTMGIHLGLMEAKVIPEVVVSRDKTETVSECLSIEPQEVPGGVRARGREEFLRNPGRRICVPLCFPFSSGKLIKSSSDCTVGKAEGYRWDLRAVKGCSFGVRVRLLISKVANMSSDPYQPYRLAFICQVVECSDCL